jgi:hypothetical protein
MGLEHPDDMSSVILTSLWRTLHGEPLRVDEQVKGYQAYWRVAKHPDPKSNPACPSGIVTTQSYSPASAGDTMRQVHIGQCCADLRVWAYEVDRGWFPAEVEQLRVWNEDAGARYDACKVQ